MSVLSYYFHMKNRIFVVSRSSNSQKKKSWSSLIWHSGFAPFLIPQYFEAPVVTNSHYPLWQSQLVPSNRGGGAHGHLALIQSPVNCLIHPGVNFEVSIYPGPTPALPDHATRNQIMEANCQYRIDQCEYAIYIPVKRTLKTQLTSAIAFLFTDKVHDDTMGFANATTLQLLSHLRTTYRALRSDQLEADAMQLSRQWNP